MAAAALALGCGAPADTPEARVRGVLAALEAAAQAKDAPAMKALVSADYRDARGRDRDAIAGLVRFHFLRNRTVHLLVRVTDVTVESSGTEARASAFVAMAGTALPGVEALADVRADLYRFDLALREEPDGEWRLTGGDWAPATAHDFR